MERLIKKKFLIFSIFFCSLLLSLYFKENSSGGAKIDFEITRPFIESFNNGFLAGINHLIQTGFLHFPTHYLLIFYFEKIFGNTITQILYIILSAFLPLIFYTVLKKKFKSADKSYLFLISSIIFLSPYFRSSSIWITSDNIALIFFCLSISKYLSAHNDKKIFKNFSLCFLLLAIASYLRPYYSIFVIIFLFEAYKKILFSRFIALVNLNLILALPALIYLYIFKINNTLDHEAVKPHLIKNFFFFLSISAFYFIPIFLNNNFIKKSISFYKKEKKIIFILITVFIFFSLSNYSENLSNVLGGGVIYRICKYFNLGLIYFIICFLSLLIIYQLIIFNKKNLLIISCVFFAFPFTIIYQKYYDPLIWIIMFSLIDYSFINEIILKRKFSLKLTYVYFILFLVSANIYYLK